MGNSEYLATTNKRYVFGLFSMFSTHPTLPIKGMFFMQDFVLIHMVVHQFVQCEIKRVTGKAFRKIELLNMCGLNRLEMRQN